MKRWLSRLRRALWLSLLVPVMATVVAIAAAPTRALVAAENLFYDARLRTFSPPATRSKDIVILGIDDRTVQDIARNRQYARNYGNYPYSRRLWARVFEHLIAEGARAVAMDSVMDEPDVSPDNDEALGLFIGEHHVPFYLGFAVSGQTVVRRKKRQSGRERARRGGEQGGGSGPIRGIWAKFGLRRAPFGQVPICV